MTLRSRIGGALRALRGRTAQPAVGNDAPRNELGRAIEAVAAAPIKEVQARGYHLQKRDYYSALNDLFFLEENPDLWHGRALPASIAWDIDAQVAELRQLAPYVSELAEVTMDPPPGPPRFHWNNDFWRGADAAIHYGLLRDVKPRRVVEIGAGWSSLLMAEALERNRTEGGEPTDVHQIEPYPRTELLSALPADWKLHEVILQRADLALFESLEPGDVCFYDGSHVARAGSDVVWFFFEILPQLQPGVLVHIHDIFWPNDYPDEWIFERGQTWNEQYVLQAFLMYNDAFEVIVCNSMLTYSRPEAMKQLFQGVAETQHSGVSVWLRRTAHGGVVDESNIDS